MGDSESIILWENKSLWCTIKKERAIDPYRASQVTLMVKNLPANSRDKRDMCSVPGSGRSPGIGNGNPLQYFAWRTPRTQEPGKSRTWAHTHTWIHVYSHVCRHLTLCGPMDYRLPVSSVHGVLQARILEWISMPSSRASSRPRDQTCISCISCTGRQVLYH